MKFNFNREVGYELPEGVCSDYFLALRAIASSPKEVEDIFKKHQYNLHMTGEFLKQMTVNAKEIAELDDVLTEIDMLGLKDVFSSNLRVANFKRSFVERLKVFLNNNFPYLNEDKTFISELYSVGFASRLQYCIDNGYPYQNPDQTFRKELYDTKLFAEYTAHKPIKELNTAQQIDARIDEKSRSIQEKLNHMDAEDKQVYNQIVTALNYLILENPTNEYLPKVVNNITKKVIDSIARQEYRFLPLSDIIDGVMFEGLDVTPEMESVRELVLSAFPDERGQSEGRRLA